MTDAVKLIILSAVVAVSLTPEAKAQSKLDKTLQNESSVLGTLEKDLMPSLGPQIQSVAKQMGDNNIGNEVNQLQGSGQGLGQSNNLMSEMSSLAKQVQHIPGIGQLLGGLMNSTLGGGNIPQFAKPAVTSHLLPGHAPANAIASSGGGMLGGMNMVNQLLGTSSLGGSPAEQKEMNEAARILPQAVQSSEQENQEIQQLLKQ